MVFWVGWASVVFCAASFGASLLTLVEPFMVFFEDFLCRFFEDSRETDLDLLDEVEQWPIILLTKIFEGITGLIN